MDYLKVSHDFSVINQRSQAYVTEACRPWKLSYSEHVPFRKKDKLYKRYREVLDKLYKDLHMTAGRRRLENFRKGMEEKGGSELTRELNRLQTALEAKRNEIKNYETNLSFFKIILPPKTIYSIFNTAT